VVPPWLQLMAESLPTLLWAGLVYTPRLASVSPNGRVGQYQIDASASADGAPPPGEQETVAAPAARRAAVAAINAIESAFGEIGLISCLPCPRRRVATAQLRRWTERSSRRRSRAPRSRWAGA